jgi:hypothetical protein
MACSAFIPDRHDLSRQLLLEQVLAQFHFGHGVDRDVNEPQSLGEDTFVIFGAANQR